MRRALALPVVAAVALAACSRRDRAAADSSGAPVAVDSAAADPCGLVRTAQHPDAEPLLREYVQRDAAGEFLARDPWFAGAVDCPRREAPSSSTFAVVGEYAVQGVAATDTIASAVVGYRQVGLVQGAGTNHASFDAAPGVVVDTLTARRTPWGWRLTSPAPRGAILYSALPVRQTLGSAAYLLVAQLAKRR